MAVQPNFDDIWRKDIMRDHADQVIKVYTQFEQEVLAGGDRRRKALDRREEDARAAGPHWTEPADYVRTKEEEALAGRAVEGVVEGLRVIRFTPGLNTLLNKQLQQEQPDVQLTIAQELAQIVEEKAAAEAEGERREARAKKLTEALVEKMLAEGMTKLTVNGVTFSLRKDSWVTIKRDADPDVVKQAFIKAKCEQYLKYPQELSVRKFSEYNRELGKERVKEGDGFRRRTILDEHPELRGVVEIAEGGVKLSATRVPKEREGEGATHAVELEDVATT